MSNYVVGELFPGCAVSAERCTWHVNQHSVLGLAVREVGNNMIQIIRRVFTTFSDRKYFIIGMGVMGAASWVGAQVYFGRYLSSALVHQPTDYGAPGPLLAIDLDEDPDDDESIDGDAVVDHGELGPQLDGEHCDWEEQARSALECGGHDERSMMQYQIKRRKRLRLKRRLCAYLVAAARLQYGDSVTGQVVVGSKVSETTIRAFVNNKFVDFFRLNNIEDLYKLAAGLQLEVVTKAVDSCQLYDRSRCRVAGRAPVPGALALLSPEVELGRQYRVLIHHGIFYTKRYGLVDVLTGEATLSELVRSRFAVERPLLRP